MGYTGTSLPNLSDAIVAKWQQILAATIQHKSSKKSEGLISKLKLLYNVFGPLEGSKQTVNTEYSNLIYTSIEKEQHQHTRRAVFLVQVQDSLVLVLTDIWC